MYEVNLNLIIDGFTTRKASEILINPGIFRWGIISSILGTYELLKLHVFFHNCHTLLANKYEWMVYWSFSPQVDQLSASQPQPEVDKPPDLRLKNGKSTSVWG